MSMSINIHDVDTVLVSAEFERLDLADEDGNTITLYSPDGEEWQRKLYWERVAVAILAALDQPSGAQPIDSAMGTGIAEALGVLEARIIDRRIRQMDIDESVADRIVAGAWYCPLCQGTWESEQPPVQHGLIGHSPCEGIRVRRPQTVER